MHRKILREEVGRVDLHPRLRTMHLHTPTGHRIRHRRNMTQKSLLVCLLGRSVIEIRARLIKGLGHHEAMVDALLATAFNLQDTFGQLLLHGEIKWRACYWSDFARGDGSRCGDGNVVVAGQLQGVVEHLATQTATKVP